MQPAPKNEQSHGEKRLVATSFRYSEELLARVRHHAKRLGVRMVWLMNEGVRTHLAHLDEEEQQTLANQTKRFSLIDERQRLLNKRDPKFTSSRTTMPIPDKFDKGFVRYAEFLEAAISVEDRARRANEILDDIRTRVSSPEEELRVHEALQEFLTSRKNTKTAPPAPAAPTARLIDAMK